MQVKITEIREAIIDLIPENYSEEDRTIKRMIEIEKENSEEFTDYMDTIDASSSITFEPIQQEITCNH